MADALYLIGEIWNNHRWVFWAGGAWYVFMCAVQALPRPAAENDKFYRWFYAFANALSANWGLIIKTVKDRQWAKALEAENGKTP